MNIFFEVFNILLLDFNVYIVFYWVDEMGYRKVGGEVVLGRGDEDSKFFLRCL